MTTQFESDYGHNVPLAKKIISDPFKAPEQKIEAQEFLDSLSMHNTPTIVIPAKPNPTYELEREADAAIRYLTQFTSSSRLDPDLRMALSDIKNIVKMLKTTLVHMSEEAQANHDKLVEVVRSQRLM